MQTQRKAFRALMPIGPLVCAQNAQPLVGVDVECGVCRHTDTPRARVDFNSNSKLASQHARALTVLGPTPRSTPPVIVMNVLTSFRNFSPFGVHLGPLRWHSTTPPTVLSCSAVQSIPPSRHVLECLNVCSHNFPTRHADGRCRHRAPHCQNSP